MEITIIIYAEKLQPNNKDIIYKDYNEYQILYKNL
jgi:hypothetical protein